MATLGKQNYCLGREKTLLSPFTYFLLFEFFLPYACITFTRIIVCVCVCIYFHSILENPYSLKSREMGPILDCSKDASQTSLVLLRALTSSQLLFFFLSFLVVKTGLWGNSQRASVQGSFSYRMKEDKWMNIQVGDIVKVENNQSVTVSTSLGCGFCSFGLSGHKGTLLALLLPLLLVTFICLTLPLEIDSFCGKKLVLSTSHQSHR